jgi:hypothetical protein
MKGTKNPNGFIDKPYPKSVLIVCGLLALSSYSYCLYQGVLTAMRYLRLWGTPNAEEKEWDSGILISAKWFLVSALLSIVLWSLLIYFRKKPVRL